MKKVRVQFYITEETDKIFKKFKVNIKEIVENAAMNLSQQDETQKALAEVFKALEKLSKCSK